MKIVKKIIPKTEIETYTCEHCGYESRGKHVVGECERRCLLKKNCKHKYSYSIEIKNDYALEISKECEKCDDIKYMDLDPYNISSGTCKKIWNEAQSLS